jgi:hypothetical protein
MTLPTASRIGLAARCLWPWSPEAQPWPEEPPTAAMRFGRAVHEAAEQQLALGPPPRLEDLAERHALTPGEARRLESVTGAVVAYLHALRADGWSIAAVEVSYALDLATGAARVIGDHRDYKAARPGEVCGTVDIIARHEDGRLRVIDWKTGREARQTRAIDTPQMRTLGLAVARAHEVDEVLVELVHLDEDGFEADHAALDAFELAAVAADLRGTLAPLLAGEPVEPRPGAWCERCPVRAACPATRAALARVDGDLAAWPIAAELESADQVRLVLHRLPVLRAALDALEDAARRYAATRGPVEVRPGVVWGPVEHPGRESITATPEALAIVRARLGEHAEKALEVTITKASLERAARAAGSGGRGALKATLAPLLDELRAAKALRRGAPYVTCEERSIPTTTPPTEGPT